MLVVSRFVRDGRLNAWMRRFASTTTCASFATAAIDDAAPNQPSTSGQAIFSSSKQLSNSSIGAYYSLDRALIPEAGRSYAGAFHAPREPGHERRGGCKALQHEIEATGVHAVMYRPVMHTLFGAVAERGTPSPNPNLTNHQRLLLTGPTGAGKSIALVSLVEWARNHGWLVFYVPSCSALVRGGYFARRGSSRHWDTLTSAQQLLKGMLDAHGPQLKKLPVLRLAEQQQPVNSLSGGEGAATAGAPAAEAAELPAKPPHSQSRTLHDLVAEGLAGEDNAELAVDSVLELVRQLAAASSTATASASAASGSRPPLPVLFALDDYNCLYGATDYGWYSPTDDPRKSRRRAIHTDDLMLASGLRLMGAPQLGGATVVAATCTSPSLPAPTALSSQLPYTELPVMGFSEVETRNALFHYHATGHADSLATSRQARQLHALTQGNARELRMNASTLGIRLS